MDQNRHRSMKSNRDHQTNDHLINILTSKNTKKLFQGIPIDFNKIRQQSNVLYSKRIKIILLLVEMVTLRFN